MENKQNYKRKFVKVLRRIKLTYFISLLASTALFGQGRERTNFNEGWFFKLDAVGDYVKTSDMKDWRGLSLPHDWSIEMSFAENSPAGSGGAYLSGGVGWYKKKFILPPSLQGKQISIEFEGIYENSDVWLNGRHIGHRPNGFIGFSYDLTPYLNHNGKENILTVKADNSKQPNTRFYSGSGIYRSVWLLAKEAVSVSYQGVYVKPLTVSSTKATIILQAHVDNKLQAVENVVLRSHIYAPDGQEVARNDSKIALHGQEIVLNQEIQIDKPQLWDIEQPQQYRAVVEIIKGKKVIDHYTQMFGLRYFDFDKDKGFFLNGRSLKIRGVCMHSDLGALGMAFYKEAAVRQLRLLKEMGVNGIRTSHNPASPEFLDVCDSLGFIVMSETFDVWKSQKNPYDYHLYWDEWHRRDFIDHVKRDRNHPSLFVWCLGNEAQEQWHIKPYGEIIPRELAAIVDSLDGTRPTTVANNEMSTDNPVLMSEAVDIIGYNYNHGKWASFPQDHPEKPFIITESVSALATRGQYDPVPVDSVRLWPKRWDIPFDGGNANKRISAYDHVRTPWGSTHEQSLLLSEKFPWVAGMYVWTGFDYLGEPTPYTWPARSSYFGIIDLAGFPKDVYYLYQSTWTDKAVLHLLPHWNWEQGDEVEVVAYYNQADEVELYLNGKSQGKRQKESDALSVSWRIAYEPGELKAVSRKDGTVIKECVQRTAGTPAQLKLLSEQPAIHLGGLGFIDLQVIDQSGNPVPTADQLVEFIVEGDGVLLATDNGDPTDITRFTSSSRHTLNGKALAIVKANKKGKKITVRAKSEGCPDAIVEVVILP